jgi:hypothetical protein
MSKIFDELHARCRKDYGHLTINELAKWYSQKFKCDPNYVKEKFFEINFECCGGRTKKNHEYDKDYDGKVDKNEFVYCLL